MLWNLPISIKTLRGGRFVRGCLLVTAGVMVLHATSFNVSFDPSTSSAPPQFFTAFNDALALYQSAFADPININLQVGWGEVGGQSVGFGFVGESLTYQSGSFPYAQVRSALIGDAKTKADAMAVGTLSVTDPTGGKPFLMANADAKALGLLVGNATGIDGAVGFSSTVAYTFDPEQRSAAGKYDFIGLAEHEVSEVMGRYGMPQNGVYTPLDLFRYSSPSVLDLVPQNGAYFSIDGGQTAINFFNGPGGGDLGDWVGLTPDSYNAFVPTGTELRVSPGDITAMDAIGYDAVPEPRTLGLSGLACALLLAWALAAPHGTIT